MRIVRQDNKSEHFSDIKVGEVFEYDNSIYIRMEEIVGNKANAVNLATGIWATFFDDDDVDKLNAEVIIRNIED